MKKYNNYNLLKDDLTNYMKGYNQNPLITENQKKIWKRVTQASLGQYKKNNSDFKPLILLKKDNEEFYDDEPVGSISSISAERIFNYEDNHVFPPMRDIVRFGCFLHLDMYHILHLVLKNEWEYYFGHEIKEWRNFTDNSLFDVLKTADEDQMREENARAFRPDSQLIFDLFEIHGKIATKAGYTVDTFSILMSQMILQRLHWEANNSEKINGFVEAERKQLAMIKSGSIDEQDALFKARYEFDNLHRELDNMMWRINGIDIQKEKIHIKWNSIFGESQIRLQEEIIRCQQLERNLLLKKANPDFSREDIINAVKEEDEANRKKIEEQKIQRWFSEIFREKESTAKFPVTDEYIYEYKKKCLILIRQIRKLTHIDRLIHNPAYLKLTQNQKNELHQILLMALKVEPEELVLGCIGYDMRTVEGLRRVLDRINSILDNAGIEIDPDYFPNGETITEQLNWYREEIQLLEKEKELYKERLHHLITDIETKRKDLLTQLTDQHPTIKKQFEQDAESYRLKADAIETELQKLFEAA